MVPVAGHHRSPVGRSIFRAPFQKRTVSDLLNPSWSGCRTRALIALYADDAILESPLVPVLLADRNDGVLHPGDGSGEPDLKALLKIGQIWKFSRQTLVFLLFQKREDRKLVEVPMGPKERQHCCCRKRSGGLALPSGWRQ
jgi:hypothetical protein